ncbi:unnamed protein product [Closterium sp. NIES-53]
MYSLWTAQDSTDPVVARYSSLATAALGKLLLPYLIPKMSAFATVADLVTYLRTSDARYRTTIPAEFLATNQPPMFITLYFIVSRLPDSLRSVRDHFLSLDPTSLTVDLLEQHLLADETSAVAVGAAHGTPRSPFFEGCSPSALSPSFASAAAADVSITKDVGAASTSAKRRSSKGKGGRGGGGGSGGGGGGSGSGGGGSGGGGGGSGGSGSCGTGRPNSSVSGWFSVGQVGVVRAACMSFARVSVRARHAGSFTLSTAASPTLRTPGVLSLVTTSSALAERICLGIVAAALGASASGTPPGTAPTEALHTFTLDSGASRCFFRDSTTLTPLPAPVPVRLADPFAGLVVDRSSTVLPCPAVPSGSVLGLHLPLFSTNLVSTAALQDAIVTTTTPGGSSLYTLATEPSQVTASAQLSASGEVAASCSCRLLSHQTLLWHHRLGHLSLPGHRGMHSQFLVSGLPKSLPPLPPSPAPPCLPCVEGRQCAAPHASSFPLTTAPLRTLHMDVGGEFSSDLLRDFCRGEGILQSFTLPDSPQQNGIAERCIGLVMEVARTSMIHAAAPHFQWPFAVWYAVHQLKLWPRVSLPETSPTLCWTGKVGDASVFWVWGSRAFVRDTSTDKLSARATPCVFLGFVSNHPTSRRVLLSQVVTFDKPVPFYRLFPYHSAPPPPPLFLAPGPPPVDALPPQAVGSGAARGAASWGAASGGAAPRGAALSGGAAGALPRLYSQQLREWLVRHAHHRSGAPGAGGAGDTGVGGAAVTTGAGSTRGTAATSPGGARTSGARAAGTGGVGCAGAGDHTEPGAAGAGGAGVGGSGVGGPGAGGARATGAGQVLAVPSSTGLPPPFPCPPPDQSQPPLQPASPLTAPSPYTEQSGGLTERREPASRFISPVRTARRAPRSRPPPVPGTHAMPLRPSSVPLRVPLPAPPESSLPEVPYPAFDRARAASPTFSRLLATAVTDPSFDLHEEIWLRRPPGFTGTFLAGTQWSLCRPVYGLYHSGQSTAHHHSDSSHMVHQVLQRFGFQFSLPQPTPLSTSHSLSAPATDESVEPSGPYPELVCCLMYLMTCTRPDLAYPVSLLARYVAPGRH